jgi:hypothetical protein
VLTAVQLIQIALGLMRLVNWITGRIDQETWRKAGYKEALEEQTRILQASLEAADKAVEEAKNATPEERRGSLKDDT